MNSLSGLAKRLVEQELLNEQQVKDLYTLKNPDNLSLVHLVLESRYCTPTQLATAVSQEFGLAYFDLGSVDPEQLQLDLLTPEMIEKYLVLPLFKRGNTLLVAQFDPSNLKALDEIKFATGQTVEAVVTGHDKIMFFINKISTSTTALDNLDERFDLEAADAQEQVDDRSDQGAVEDAPIVRFVNKTLLDAIRGGSSDIHFEPYETVYRVRFRTDGVLHQMSKPPKTLGNKIAARLKVMSKMDISERRIPQDGRIKMRLSKFDSIDFRVNTLPTLWGEKIVLRILDATSAQMNIGSLGYDPDQEALYMEALNQPQGMILVTGPTGSGKTVSLYAGLNILNIEDTNISTAEDPVEINIEGINQVNVNAKVGLDFAEALRSFLRQDPDVVMVGEIRDMETANVAIKAAQTGHLVLSTLHTNSAPETLTRLVNMGVPPFNIATSVSLIIAQRLGRRLCSFCKKPANDIPEKVLLEEGFTKEMLKNSTIYQPVGCSGCNKGYKGRVGIYEVVKITDAISRIIMEGGNAIQIADVAKKEGFSNLRESALKKVAQGVTSIEEANRVTTD